MENCTVWRKLRTCWPRVLRPWICWLLAYACGGMTVLIAFSQVATSSNFGLLSPLSVPFNADRGFLPTQLICAVPLSYMAVATYWSFFRIKINGWYGIYPN